MASWQLFSYTPLQTSFGVNMLALDNGRPELMDIKHVIRSFINFREEGGDDVFQVHHSGDADQSA